MKLLALVLSFVFLAGCATLGGSTQAYLFPVKGPLSITNPTAEIVATATGTRRYKGRISLAMPDGELCNGRWSTLAGNGRSSTRASLIDTYGSAYGYSQSTYSSSRPSRGVAFLTCNQGRTMNVEFETGAGTSSGFGIARDNKKNIYRLMI